jgi:hypothetical protein
MSTSCVISGLAANRQVSGKYTRSLQNQALKNRNAGHFLRALSIDYWKTASPRCRAFAAKLP